MAFQGPDDEKLRQLGFDGLTPPKGWTIVDDHCDTTSYGETQRILNEKKEEVGRWQGHGCHIKLILHPTPIPSAPVKSSGGISLGATQPWDNSDPCWTCGNCDCDAYGQYGKLKHGEHCKLHKTKKRKPEEDSKEPDGGEDSERGEEPKSKKRKTQLTLEEANEAAGFVPNEITALMQRGDSQPEAYVRLLSHWPDSLQMVRRLEKQLSEEPLDAKQQTDLKAKLDADPLCGYDRFYEIKISMPEFKYQTYYFQSIPRACRALIDVLKQFPDQKVRVVSDDLAKGKSKWDLQLSAFIRKLEIVIEKKRTKMIQVEDLCLDMAPEKLIGQARLFRFWVTECQFHSKIELVKENYDYY